MQVLKSEIRDSILEISKKIFINKGYDKSTMRDIAQGSNISVGNIYRYFDSKEKILEILISDFEKDLKEFTDYLDDGIFVQKQNNKLDVYLKKLEEVFEKNETALLVLARANTNEKYVKFEDRIIKNLTDRFMKISKMLKSNTLNQVVAEAISCGIIEGVRRIINKYDKKKNNFKEVKKDVDLYIKLSVEDLMFRSVKMNK